MGNSKYETHVRPYFEDIFYWYSHDKSMKEIACELGVAESTFMKYKSQKAELSELLKKASRNKPRYLASKAERALRDKLSDREFEEVETEIYKDQSGRITRQHVKKKKKTIPADTTAIIFALKSLDPDRYGQELQKIELSGQVGTNPLEGLSEEELRRLADGESG